MNGRVVIEVPVPLGEHERITTETLTAMIGTNVRVSAGDDSWEGRVVAVGGTSAKPTVSIDVDMIVMDDIADYVRDGSLKPGSVGFDEVPDGS